MSVDELLKELARIGKERETIEKRLRAVGQKYNELSHELMRPYPGTLYFNDDPGVELNDRLDRLSLSPETRLKKADFLTVDEISKLLQRRRKLLMREHEIRYIELPEDVREGIVLPPNA